MSSNLRFNKEEVLFYFYFILILIGKSLGLGASSQLLKIITVIAFIFLGIKLVITNYKKKEIITILILISIGICTLYMSKREGILLTIVTIIGLKNIKYKKLFNIALIVKIISYIFVISLSILGFLPNKEFLQWREGIGYIARYSLGYSHPNLLHSNFFIIVLLYIYLKYERLNIMNCGIILIINELIYRISLSRTGFYAIIFMVLFSYIIRKRQKINYRLFYIIMPISIIFSFVTAILYNKVEIINKLDVLLTGRIGYSNHFLNYYNINLFGHNLFNDNSLIDNSYIILLINYGLITFVLYIWGYMKIIKKFVFLKMNKELLMISCFSIYGITEGFLSNIFLNLSLVFLANLIYKENNYE